MRSEEPSEEPQEAEKPDGPEDMETEGSGAKNNDKKEKPPRFKFECQRTGECCKREKIIISINDLQRWVRDQTIFRVMHYISMVFESEEFQLQIIKDEDGYCKLYHRDNKACTIHYNKPLYCKSYPLGYNGENYITKSKECTGLGKGKMTKDQLKELRDAAFEDYVARRQTAEVMPVLQGIFYRQLAEESQKYLDQLSPGEKDKLNKMFGKGDGTGKSD